MLQTIPRWSLPRRINPRPGLVAAGCPSDSTPAYVIRTRQRSMGNGVQWAASTRYHLITGAASQSGVITTCDLLALVDGNRGGPSKGYFDYTLSMRLLATVLKEAPRLPRQSCHFCCRHNLSYVGGPPEVGGPRQMPSLLAWLQRA